MILKTQLSLCLLALAMLGLVSSFPINQTVTTTNSNENSWPQHVSVNFTSTHTEMSNNSLQTSKANVSENAQKPLTSSDCQLIASHRQSVLQEMFASQMSNYFSPPTIQTKTSPNGEITVVNRVKSGNPAPTVFTALEHLTSKITKVIETKSTSEEGEVKTVEKDQEISFDDADFVKDYEYDYPSLVETNEMTSDEDEVQNTSTPTNAEKDSVGEYTTITPTTTTPHPNYDTEHSEMKELINDGNKNSRIKKEIFKQSGVSQLSPYREALFPSPTPLAHDNSIGDSNLSTEESWTNNETVHVEYENVQVPEQSNIPFEHSTPDSTTLTNSKLKSRQSYDNDLQQEFSLTRIANLHPYGLRLPPTPSSTEQHFLDEADLNPIPHMELSRIEPLNKTKPAPQVSVVIKNQFIIVNNVPKAIPQPSNASVLHNTNMESNIESAPASWPLVHQSTKSLPYFEEAVSTEPPTVGHVYLKQIQNRQQQQQNPEFAQVKSQRPLRPDGQHQQFSSWLPGYKHAHYQSKGHLTSELATLDYIHRNRNFASHVMPIHQNLRPMLDQSIAWNLRNTPQEFVRQSMPAPLMSIPPPLYPKLKIVCSGRRGLLGTLRALFRTVVSCANKKHMFLKRSSKERALFTE